MLSIKNLSVKTREPVLTNFRFDFCNGNLYGIAARNGSGKTSFYRAVMGLIPIDKGTIEISDNGITSCYNKGQLFYYESSEWFDTNLSGLDYLKFVKREWKSNIDIDKVIELWDMNLYIKIPIKKYSLGMKQRVLISMYLVSDAKYLLMDEITNGLDELGRKLLFELLLDLKKQGKMIIISSHYKQDIEEYCDHLLTLKNTFMEVSNL